MNSTAFFLALVLVLAYYFFSVRKWKVQNKKNPIANENSNVNLNYIPMTTMNTDTEEDEELVAIITAAIHEFTGTEDFEVVRIRPSAMNWTLTSRQDALRN